MLSDLAAVTFDASDPAQLATFWGHLLQREAVENDDGALLLGEDGQLSLRFVPGGSEPKRPHLMHLHLTSRDPEDLRAIVEGALRRGARHLDVGQRPEEGHVVLEDPEGYEFCVLPPGSAFVAGCGLLGELACDGTRELGLFWGAVLGWPLVWDQDEETAIQSPRGGTKVAWGGPPLAARPTGVRQRFQLTSRAGSPLDHIEHLVSRGATRTTVRADGVVVLADPDGNEFWVTGG